MSARRCMHTGVSLPECSCLSCNREKLRRYAPWLVARAEKGRRGQPSAGAPARVRT